MSSAAAIKYNSDLLYCEWSGDLLSSEDHVLLSEGISQSEWIQRQKTCRGLQHCQERGGRERGEREMRGEREREGERRIEPLTALFPDISMHPCSDIV